MRTSINTRVLPSVFPSINYNGTFCGKALITRVLLSVLPRWLRVNYKGNFVWTRRIKYKGTSLGFPKGVKCKLGTILCGQVLITSINYKGTSLGLPKY